MIFHCKAKSISRAAGRSATAAAAYRSGEAITDERTGEVHDYTKKQGILHKELVFPEGTKEMGRAAVWNMAEKAERRKDSKVAREWELGLPDELPHGERVALARGFAEALAKRYGVIVDVCIHAPGKAGDKRNHHAHLLTTTRKYTPDGLKEKTEILDSPKTSGKEVDVIRAIWERLCNDAFQRIGSEVRADRRTLKAQGIDRIPTRHLGAVASAMERRGVRTFRGDDNRRAKQQTEDKAELANLRKTDGGIHAAKARLAAKLKERAEQRDAEKRRQDEERKQRETLERKRQDELAEKARLEREKQRQTHGGRERERPHDDRRERGRSLW
jgi:hypothetical protein